MAGQFDIVDELKAIPVRLWCHSYAGVESHRERTRRRIFLKASEGDLTALPLPFGNQQLSSREQIHALGRSSFRKVLRVMSLIQFQCFTLNSESPGPLVWDLSTGVLSKGGDRLLRVCNEMGVAVHPNTLNDYKRKLYKEKTDADPCDRIEKVFIVLLRMIIWMRISTKRLYRMEFV